MNTLSPRIVEEFCAHCSRAYEVWLTHRELFDKNPRAAELHRSFAGDTLSLLSTVTQEYVLHQIIKLHDPAVQSGRANLSIDYIIEKGAWEPLVLEELKAVRTKLDLFSVQLRGVRNRILSHNDLETILAETTLGAFAEGEDEEYFSLLQKFANTAHAQVVGGTRPFNDLVANDVAAFLATIKV